MIHFAVVQTLSSEWFSKKISMEISKTNESTTETCGAAQMSSFSGIVVVIHWIEYRAHSYHCVENRTLTVHNKSNRIPISCMEFNVQNETNWVNLAIIATFWIFSFENLTFQNWLYLGYILVKLFHSFTIFCLFSLRMSFNLHIGTSLCIKMICYWRNKWKDFLNFNASCRFAWTKYGITTHWECFQANEVTFSSNWNEIILCETKEQIVHFSSTRMNVKTIFPYACLRW